MCLLSIAVNKNADYPLIFIGNRDEYHERESAPADWWQSDIAQDKEILAGRDLQAGGTWLGISKAGRFSVITNRPDLPPPAEAARSRGELTTRWLRNETLLPELSETHSSYGGFSLLLADTKGMQILTGGFGSGKLGQHHLDEGVTGLSNTAIDQPWPKLSWLNAELGKSLANSNPDPEMLLGLLGRTEPVPGASSHGVPATPFVLGDTYGTRCCTVVLIKSNGSCRFIERRFGPGGRPAGESAYDFRIAGSTS